MFGKKQDRSKLDLWQRRFDEAKEDASGEIAKMQRRKQLYGGDKHIATPAGTDAAKQASSVRNIVFELIESQVDSNIPTPKVTARDAQNEALAQEIEDMLRSEIDRLPFERLNDEDERTTPMQGGDYFLIEWDASERTHTTVGRADSAADPPEAGAGAKGDHGFQTGRLGVYHAGADQGVHQTALWRGCIRGG